MAEIYDETCEYQNCNKQAVFECPTCLKLQLQSSYYCSQGCFKSNWGIHKQVHKQRDDLLEQAFDYTGKLRPFPYSFIGKREIPEEIKKPDYFLFGQTDLKRQEYADKNIYVHSPEEILLIKESSRIGRNALDLGHRMALPGVTTEQIDQAVHDYIISEGAYPSPYNYFNFPRSCCTSVNECICHGIPDTRPLQEGDIINLDISVYKNEVHADLNETFCVGNVSDAAKQLVQATYESLMKAIQICKPGAMYREIGNIIQAHVDPLGYSLVRPYSGHGVGRHFH